METCSTKAWICSGLTPVTTISNCGSGAPSCANAEDKPTNVNVRAKTTVRIMPRRLPSEATAQSPEGRARKRGFTRGLPQTNWGEPRLAPIETLCRNALAGNVFCHSTRDVAELTVAAGVATGAIQRLEIRVIPLTECGL